MIEVHCDFETRNVAFPKVDLKVVGAARYAEDPDTEILCLVFSVAGGGGIAWWPGQVGIGIHLACLARDLDVMFVSHGNFERCIWPSIMVARYGFPELPPERWYDTQAVCAYKALPLAQENAVRVLGLPSQKDMEGSRLTIGLSRVSKAGKVAVPVISVETQARVIQYCMTDVAGELEMHRELGYLSPYERRVWLLDQHINQRGVGIDRPYIRQAKAIVALASRPMLAEFADLTDGLKPTQRDKLVAWCGDQGVKLDGLRKEYLTRLLGAEDEEEDDASDDGLPSELPEAMDLPPAMRRALEIRQVLGSASIKKLGRFEQWASADGRLRYLLQYHAAGTGRWGGRGPQTHNLPRPSLKVAYKPDPKNPGEWLERSPSIEAVVNAIMTGDPDFVRAVLGDPIEVVIHGLRHALKAAVGHVFATGDFAGIEARMVLALAGQHDMCDLMASGADVYLAMADAIYGKPPGTLTKDDVKERTIGKNTVLGCGFQMGWETFKRRYCPDQSDDFAKGAIRGYRVLKAPLVPKVWAGLEEAALRAVVDRTPQEAFGVTYQISGNFLTARLPDGQLLWYFHPEITTKGMPWDATDIRVCWSYYAMKMGRWKRIYAYGGLLTENVVQALARGLLVEAMFRLEAHGYPLVMTVHDEAMAEVITGRADKKAFEEIMAERPAWARAIKVPVAVEGWIGERYRK